MDKKSSYVALIVVAIIAIGGYYFPRITEIIRENKIETQLGVAAGPDHTEHQVFQGNFTRGGRVVATTSDVAAVTLTSSELDRETGYLSWTADLATTITTMASTSAPFSNLKTGETVETIFYSATTTTGAGALITFASGTGVDLQEDEGGTVTVNGLEAAKLTFLKKSDSDILFIVEPYQVGD